MRIAIVTDAWMPQINGVVRTLSTIRGELQSMGHDVAVVAPSDFLSVPCPTYNEIRLALARPAHVGRRLAAFRPDAVHIATEGPLGLAARHWCVTRGLSFTTAYHTHFPDYVSARTGLDPAWVWRYLRWFHNASSAVMVSTPTMAATLADHGIGHAHLWGRGVDIQLFTPDGPHDPVLAALPRPIMLYVGRVAVEKNLAAFLGEDVPGTKAIVGDGPARGMLERSFPQAKFLGTLQGEALAAAYRTADVFVFPSRTDTFGLVIAEALACGTPVAAYPVQGPLDVLVPGVGMMDEDLGAAVAAALACDRGACAAHGATFSWAASANQFLSALAPLGSLREAA